MSHVLLSEENQKCLVNGLVDAFNQNLRKSLFNNLGRSYIDMLADRVAESFNGGVMDIINVAKKLTDRDIEK